MSDYIKVQLGSSFLLNSGICGFINFLRSNDAAEGTDYIISNQDLEISKSYLVENDIPGMYVETAVRLFEQDTRYYRVVNEESKEIRILNDDIANLDEKKSKRLSELYKNFEDMMLKASFKSGYKIMAEYDDVIPVTEDIITNLKKEKDPVVKYDIYKNILKLLEQKTVKNILVFKEITYSKLKLFFGESEFCLKTNTGKTGASVFDKDFYQPLLKELCADEKKKKKLCIECLNYSSDTKSISFMIDTTDDVNRKKSYYWNCKPDAFVCPVCAFIYSFSPFGFVFTGSDCVFINSNGNINNLVNIMETYRVKNDIDNDEKSGRKKKLYRAFTSEKVDMLKMKLSNFQVITRNSEFSHFNFSVIDRDTIRKLNDGKKYLTNIEKIWVKINKSDSFLSVYDEVMDCIIERKSFYYLIDSIMKAELSTGNNIGYLMNVLKLQIIFNGGAEMDNLNKKVDAAFFAGRDLRTKILGNNADSPSGEDDNSIRGFVYRLVNLASVGDTSQFIDTVIRIYSGFGLTIPSVFKECYKSEEIFKAIAHGFILGLKYVKYNKEETNNG